MKRTIVIIIGAVIGVILVFVLLHSALNELNTVEGKVTKVYSNELKDIVIELNGIEGKFYINRGLEKGMSVNDMQKKLMNNYVTIKYPKDSSSDGNDQHKKTINQLEYKKEIIYSKKK